MIKSDKSLFFILIFFILISGCVKDDTDVAKRTSLSGQIGGISNTTLQFSFEQFSLLGGQKSLDIEVDDAGKFKLILEMGYPLKGFVSFGNVPKTYKFSFTQVNGRDTSMQVGSVDFRSVNLYLRPGDSLFMTADVNHIQESLKFSGTGSADNYFVNLEEWTFNDYRRKYLNNYYYITFLEPAAFKDVKEELLEHKKAFLAENVRENDLSPHLVRLYGNQYEWEFIQTLVSYPGSHAGFNDGREAKLPVDFFDFIQTAEIPENIDDLGISAYYYLSSLMREKHALAILGKQTDTEFYDFLDQELPEELAYLYKAYALDRDFNKKLYDVFDDSCPYPELAELVKQKYSHLEGMLAGNPFPAFKLENIDGDLVALEDLAGNFVYIDFWATWCKPCVKEIPFLEELLEEMKDKPIKFVSISIDREADKAKWHNFVIENNMKGIQLWANKEHHDKFSKNLNIKSIPRFVLLDQEGKIINPKEKRPSDFRLKKILEEL